MTRVLTLPLRVVSEANRRDHWAAKARRVKAQRRTVALAWLSADLPRGRKPDMVTLTRIAPRRLDSDAAVGCFKAVRDAVAELCGFNDREGTWLYGQERGPAGYYGVRIEVTWVEDAEARNAGGL